MPDPSWLNRAKLPEYIATLDDLLDDTRSGLTKAQREGIQAGLDALLDLRNSVPVDMGSLHGPVDAAQCLEVVRAAVRDRILDGRDVLMTIVPFLPSNAEMNDEIEALKDHVIDLRNEHEALDKDLKRYEVLADQLTEVVTAWKNAR